MTSGYLTTHILDTARGCPAQGITITAYGVDGAGKRDKLAEMITNDDGRTDTPLLPQGSFPAASYELVFHAGGYIADHFPDQGQPFFDKISVVFHSNDSDAHYHIPLLLSPYGYSTYRGS